MAGKPPGPLTLGILRLLTDLGPMTRAELMRELGVDREKCAAVVSRLAHPAKTKPKRIYVVEYVHEDDHGRRYPRAVYALGDRKDARKPKPDPAAVSARYRERNKGQVASVFDLGRAGRGRQRTIKEGACQN